MNYIEPIEPFGSDDEYADRFVKDSGKNPIEFEEVLKDPQGGDRRSVNDKHDLRNYRWLYVLTILFFLGLTGRSAFLQIVQGEQYRGLAEGNRVRAIVESAPRGILYDRHGTQLVENIPGYQLALIPSDVPADKNERIEFFKELAPIVDLTTEEIEDVYLKHNARSLDPVPLADISRETALTLESSGNGLPGVQVIVQAIRKYVSPETLSHVAGYVGNLSEEDTVEYPDYELIDKIGKAGVEQSHESSLRGVNGAKNVEVDALGNIVNVLASVPPVPGSDLILTIDAGLQEILYSSLKEAAERSGENRAAAVAIDPRNGEILALVSIPGFDLNAISEGRDSAALEKIFTDPNQPLFTRPVLGTYPPGSTFKPFIAAGALEADNIDRNTTFVSTGSIEVGGQIFKDWKPGGHGEVNIIGALAESVNGFFFSIGGGYENIDGLGIAEIDRVASAFGFGQESQVDLPSEEAGLLPSPEWKLANYNEDWFLGDTYNVAIGQGFVLVTPLQLANATAAIANGGKLWWPHIGRTIIKSDGAKEEIQTYTLREKVMSSESISLVREGMLATVNGGTGRLLADLPVQAAGKTGTAQFGSGEPNAWFTAFAPYDEPTIAIVILVEEAGEGSDFSAPVAKEALNYYFRERNNDEDIR